MLVNSVCIVSPLCLRAASFSAPLMRCISSRVRSVLLLLLDWLVRTGAPAGKVPPTVMTGPPPPPLLLLLLALPPPLLPLLLLKSWRTIWKPCCVVSPCEVFEFGFEIASLGLRGH